MCRLKTASRPKKNCCSRRWPRPNAWLCWIVSRRAIGRNNSMVAASPTQTDAVVQAFSDWSEKLRWDALSEKTRKTVKYELLDYLGCLLVGRALMGIPGWIAELAARGGRADAAIIGGP